ncbi:hypothetical protein V490_00222 [Pseudogymnoascus sp. VKM F-3557]|nr:hypothetical protein V490_00222 [Pseudogymnoascus sp. VKM F-3557]
MFGERKPSGFWRVQHARSYTSYDEDSGFDSQARFYMDYSHRISKGIIERQLDYKNREPTGLISVFASLDAARKRSSELSQKGCQDVTIASISTTSLQEDILKIQFWNPTVKGLEIVELPVLRNEYTILFSTPEVLARLNVNSRSEPTISVLDGEKHGLPGDTLSLAFHGKLRLHEDVRDLISPGTVILASQTRGSPPDGLPDDIDGLSPPSPPHGLNEPTPGIH